MKKTIKTILPAACLIAALASFGVTYAYLIASDAKLNEFSVGENDIELMEKFTAPEELKPGTEFPKNPYVHNTGDLPCLVRMRVDFSDSDAEKFCDLEYIGNTGYNRLSWLYDEDEGYYYYTKVLKPGDYTPVLFDKVRIKEEYDENKMIDFDIMIYVESKEWQYTNVSDIENVGFETVDEAKKMWGGK